MSVEFAEYELAHPGGEAGGAVEGRGFGGFVDYGEDLADGEHTGGEVGG